MATVHGQHVTSASAPIPLKIVIIGQLSFLSILSSRALRAVRAETNTRAHPRRKNRRWWNGKVVYHDGLVAERL